jgi:hypothetical protein
MTATHAPETVLKRHPISGILFGAMLGIGVAIYLVLFSITPFEWATIGIVVGVGAVLGFLWGMFAPAKQVREMPQADHQPMFTRVSPDDPNPASYEQAFGSSTSSRGAFAADSSPAPAPPSAEPDPAPPADSPADTADSPADTADELAFGAGEEPPTTDT